MSEKTSPQEELLYEARRTTHAVRAIARFILLLATYQVIAAVVVFVGSLMSASEEFLVPGVFFVVVGALVAIVGLVHSLSLKATVSSPYPIDSIPGMSRAQQVQPP